MEKEGRAKVSKLHYGFQYFSHQSAQKKKDSEYTDYGSQDEKESKNKENGYYDKIISKNTYLALDQYKTSPCQILLYCFWVSWVMSLFRLKLKRIMIN